MSVRQELLDVRMGALTLLEAITALAGLDCSLLMISLLVQVQSNETSCRTDNTFAQ